MAESFPHLLASGDRPPPRPSKAPPPRASSAVPKKGGEDKVAEAYRDLLAEIVEKKKKQAEVRKRPPKKKKSGVIKAVLAVILPPAVAAVWIFNPFAPKPPPPPRIPDEALTWQNALIDAALAIREWKDSAGAFPVDLAAAEIPLRGVTFTVEGDDAFVLQTFTMEGVVTVWMEGEMLGTGPRPVTPDPPPAPEFLPP